MAFRPWVTAVEQHHYVEWLGRLELPAAGVSAGIDMALQLVARLAGLERAREVRRGIKYDHHPPV